MGTREEVVTFLHRRLILSLLKPSSVSRYFSQENEPQADKSHRIIYNKKYVISSYLM